MITKLDVIRKAYKSDDDIRNSLTIDPEDAFDFDRTWNGKYVWNYCGLCNRPKLGHREEKCQNSGEGYSREVVERFEKLVLNIEGVRKEIVKYVEKKDAEKRMWMINQKLELEKALPHRTNVMIGRTEIPKWS